ncbi:magnesium/cobalt transporter CorA [bacterium]|nr:magnesium/cobalt transporter CorA [bacterium]
MSKLFTKRNTKVGAKPGTLMISKEAQQPRIRIIRFTKEEHFDTMIDDVKGVAEHLTKPGVVWIDVQGMGDETVIRELGELFSIHMLALESIVNIPQRPKTEAFEQHQLFISRMVSLGEQNMLDVEQVSILLGKNYVLTFQERFGDVLDPVRKRIKTKSTMMRRSGPDYLAYAIIDTIIDGYYPVLEHYGEYLEELEAKVVANASSNMLDKINKSKRNLLILRRGIWPQRDALNTLIRDDCPFIIDETKVFLRDCHDHCTQVADVLETFRETAGALLSTYLSALGNKQNEVMRVLTIVSSIFIPLTFMAGIYGMNFENIPELKISFGYPTLLVVMVITVIGMLLYFKRLGWIWSNSSDD